MKLETLIQDTTKIIGNIQNQAMNALLEVGFVFSPVHAAKKVMGDYYRGQSLSHLHA